MWETWIAQTRDKLRWSRADVFRYGGGAAAICVAMLIVLSAMGRIWWCEAGDWAPWSWDIWSRHTSQHLIDPYTFTHILHGILFYGVLHLALGRWVSVKNRFLITLALEAAWEIGENTSYVIERYREVTISLDYFGDSVLNSLADVLACASGYGLAAILPVWGSFAFFFLMEVVLVLWIRDSLLINIVMLVFPIDAIRQWQAPQ